MTQPLSPSSPVPPGALPSADADCPRCQKPQVLCVCDEVRPLANRIALVILQHPQEQDRTLGTAGLAAHLFKNATLKIGLSWPSLSKMLGRPAEAARWGVLYLGSASAADLVGGAPGPQTGGGYDPLRQNAPREAPGVLVLTKKGTLSPDQNTILKNLEGVIVLDGTWSQAKALWWRNAWMLKCRRLILNPTAPSAYGRLRKEPRRDALSTIEAAGMLLGHLESRTELETGARAAFDTMLMRFRAIKRSHPELTRR